MCIQKLKYKRWLWMLCAFPLMDLFASTPSLPPTPITIQSDTASIEQLSHQAIYEGNVILTQDEHVLYANKLTIKKDPKKQFTVITATGDPATFTGKRHTDPHPINATAKIIHYYPDKKLIVLEGAATLEHQKDTFQGPTLSYQLDKQIISANKQSNERPTFVLHPRA